jgi:hypothetical protein
VHAAKKAARSLLLSIAMRIEPGRLVRERYRLGTSLVPFLGLAAFSDEAGRKETTMSGLIDERRGAKIGSDQASRVSRISPAAA